jgi:hypothetical protein
MTGIERSSTSYFGEALRRPTVWRPIRCVTLAQVGQQGPEMAGLHNEKPAKRFAAVWGSLPGLASGAVTGQCCGRHWHLEGLTITAVVLTSWQRGM